MKPFTLTVQEQDQPNDIDDAAQFLQSLGFSPNLLNTKCPHNEARDCNQCDMDCSYKRWLTSHTEDVEEEDTQ